jgi:two-component system LytT family response regulator
MLSHSSPSRRLSEPPHLTVFRGQKLLLSSIEYLQGDGNYTHLHLTDGTRLILSKTLKYYENLLATHGFVRCHKSYLVNQQFIKTITRRHVLLYNGMELPVARRREV